MDLQIVIIAVLGGLSVFLLVVSLPMLGDSLFYSAYASAQRSSEQSIKDLRMSNLSAKQVIVRTLLGALVVAIIVYIFSGSLITGLLVGFCMLFAPRFVFNHLRQKRLARFEEQLPAALDQLTSSAKAGLSLPQALEEVAKTAPSPVGEEFGAISNDYQLGTDMQEAIESARARIDSQAFSLVASALLVNIEKGGNLPDALLTMSDSLKEVWRLEQKLITASAEGKKAMLVISAVPIFVLILVMVMQPDIAETLTSTLSGMAILAASVALYVLGIVWLRRIMGTEI